MGRPNKLAQFVKTSNLLQGVFKPCMDDARETYYLLNRYVFDGGLSMPPINIRRVHSIWGACDGIVDNEGDFKVREIILNSRMPNLAMFVTTMAHEMVHQFQWEVLNPERELEGLAPIMSHGPSFYAWRKPLNAYGIPLTRG